MIRILIADGSDVVRKLLKLLLESCEGWIVCGEARDGQEAVRKSLELKPDAVILDLAMEGLNGLLAAREISNALPNVPILLHTVNNIPAVVAEAKKFGIRRVIGKGGDGELLLNAIYEELEARPRGISSQLDDISPAIDSPAESDAANKDKNGDLPKPN